MSNIKINKILSQKEKVNIENGFLEIYSTKPSSNSLSGSLVLHGGLGINTVYNASNSSCGGALTVNGGLGVVKDTFLGGNLELDNNASTFRIKGIQYNRIFMDTINNKNFYISLDGFKKQIDFQSETVFINYNTPSLNSSIGSVVISGGLSINCSENASNSSCGGALTVGGGVSLLSDLYVGKNIYTSDTIYAKEINIGEVIDIYNGCIESQKNLEIKSNGNVEIQNGIIVSNDQISLNKKVIVNNFDTVFNYGIQINSTENAYDILKGGAVTIKGGLSVLKNVYIGGDVLQIPIGTTESRPMYANKGSIRYNQDTQQFEGLGPGGNWGSLGGVCDIDQDTKIVAENVPGDDNDTLEFYTDGEKRMVINQNGSIVINSPKNTRTVTFFHQNENVNEKVEFISLNDAQKNISLGIQNKNDFYITTSLEKVSINFNDLATTYFTKDNIVLVKPVKVESGEIQLIDYKIKSSEKQFSINDNQFIISNENIGIGTSTPKEKLSIKGNIELGETFEDYHYIKIHGGSNDFFINGQNDGVSFGFNVYKNKNEWIVPNKNVVTKRFHMNESHIAFYSGGSDKEYSEKMLLFMDNSGNIGINTNNPGYTLDINGTLCVNNNVIFKNTKDNTFIVELYSQFKNEVILESSLEIQDIVVAKRGIEVSSSNDTNVPALHVKNGLSLFEGGIICNSDIQGNPNTNSTFGKVYITGTSDSYPETLLTVNGDLIAKTIFTDNIQTSENCIVGKELVLNGNVSSTISFQSEKGEPFYNIKYSPEELFIETGKSKVFSIDRTNGNVNIPCGLSTNSIQAKSIYTENQVICDNLVITSTVGSSSKETGSVIINGGLGVMENLNVGGNTIINGSLTVLGITNQIETTNTVLKDNIILLNSAPSGSKDAGIVIERYQKDNDLGEGDVVNDNIYVSFHLNSLDQDILESNQVLLPQEASDIDNYYVGWWIRVASGFSANQIRKITSYNGFTKIAIVSSPWTSQNPTDIIHLYKRPYVGLFFNEIHDRFEILSTLKEPESKTDNYTDLLTLKSKSITTENGYKVVSDSRIRKDIEEYKSQTILDDIDKLKSIRYSNTNNNTKMLGLISEEVKDLFPELVTEEDYSSIDYSQMVIILLECIKELKKLIIKN